MLLCAHSFFAGKEGVLPPPAQVASLLCTLRAYWAAFTVRAGRALIRTHVRPFAGNLRQAAARLPILHFASSVIVLEGLIPV